MVSLNTWAMGRGSVALRGLLFGPVRAKHPLPASGPAHSEGSLINRHFSSPGTVRNQHLTCPPLVAHPQGFTISCVLLKFLEVDFKFLEDERPSLLIHCAPSTLVPCLVHNYRDSYFQTRNPWKRPNKYKRSLRFRGTVYLKLGLPYT